MRLPALTRAGLVVAAALLGVLGGAGPAAAHATLLVTTPIADGAVAEAPTHLELVFNERVVVQEVALRDAAGEPAELGAVATGAGGRAVTVPVEAELPAGVYTVRWEVTGTDGDRHGDEFRFAVGAAVVDPGTSTGGRLDVAWGSAVLRGLLFAALAIALGGLVGQWLVRAARAINPGLPEVSSWLPAATLAGLGAAVGLVMPLADQLGSVPGRVVLAEAVGFAAAAGLVALRRPAWAVVPLLVVVAAEGVRSHAQTSGGRTRLRLGFPAERRFAELVLGPDGRIVAETLTGPKHLIRRTFRYDHDERGEDQS